MKGTILKTIIALSIALPSLAWAADNSTGEMKTECAKQEQITRDDVVTSSESSGGATSVPDTVTK